MIELDYDSTIFSVAFSPDGRRCATGSSYYAQVWDTSSGKVLMYLQGHEKAVVSVAFTSDGRRLVTSSLDHTIKIWCVENNGSHNGEAYDPVMTLEGHKDIVNEVCFSPDGRRILSGCEDNSIRIWNLDEQIIMNQIYCFFKDTQIIIIWQNYYVNWLKFMVRYVKICQIMKILIIFHTQT